MQGVEMEFHKRSLAKLFSNTLLAFNQRLIETMARILLTELQVAERR